MSTAAPQTLLATKLGGVIVDQDRIAVGSTLLYVGFRGTVRLQQPGRPVVTLGAWDDGADVLAARYHEAVAA